LFSKGEKKSKVPEKRSVLGRGRTPLTGGRSIAKRAFIVLYCKKCQEQHGSNKKDECSEAILSQ
jgi:hypothetical protein